MTFYLKYRPKNLDELDLPEVSDSLKKIAKSGKMPHAFLFARPKGTGKTSAARILAKIINCEGKNPPCDKCEQCLSIMRGNNLDVIEMDAASHRGIDDVRVLRDAVKLAPTKAKKKIYIIDEAHMLTTEASNALLKTLEEPPEHVVFILATTNPEKLIATIRSRTTFISFRKGKPEEILKSLKRVAGGEKLKIKDDALSLIAEASEGAFRDAIKMLEQIAIESADLSKEFLERHLFAKGKINLDSFVGLLVKKDAKGLIEEIEGFGKSGVSIESFIEAILERLKSALLFKVGAGGEDIGELSKGSLIQLIEFLTQAKVQISDSPIEELPFEIAVVKWCGNGDETQSKPEPVPEPSSKSDDSPSTAPASKESSVAQESMGIEVNDEAWRMILSSVKPINASIEALLRAARPIAYDGKTLTLGVFYKFHKERLEDAQHRRVLESIVAEVLKSPTRVICTLVEPPARKVVEEAKREPVLTEGKDEDIIKVAEEIFSN